MGRFFINSVLLSLVGCFLFYHKYVFVWFLHVTLLYYNKKLTIKYDYSN